MKTKWSSLAWLILILALSPVSFNQPVTAKAKFLKAQIAQTPASQYTFENYKQECLARAAREGLPRQAAEQLCTCTINKFRAQYSIQEFRALVQKSKSDTVVAERLAEVGETCLYEN